MTKRFKQKQKQNENEWMKFYATTISINKTPLDGNKYIHTAVLCQNTVPIHLHLWGLRNLGSDILYQPDIFFPFSSNISCRKKKKKGNNITYLLIIKSRKPQAYIYKDINWVHYCIVYVMLLLPVFYIGWTILNPIN